VHELNNYKSYKDYVGKDSKFEHGLLIGLISSHKDNAIMLYQKRAVNTCHPKFVEKKGKNAEKNH
jgi:hypothetical protein